MSFLKFEEKISPVDISLSLTYWRPWNFIEIGEITMVNSIREVYHGYMDTGTLRDRTMADKLMYIPNDITQNYFFVGYNVWALKLVSQPIKIQ